MCLLYGDLMEYNTDEIMKCLGLNFGDYCHVYSCADKDPMDPWAVGNLRAVRIVNNYVRFQVKAGDGDGRWFSHCEKITKDEGEELLKRRLDE